MSGSRVPVLAKGPEVERARAAFDLARLGAEPVCMTGAPGANPEDWADDGEFQQTAAGWCVESKCKLLEQCAVYALLAKEPIGVWGGMTAAQRRAILRQRDKKVLVPA